MPLGSAYEQDAIDALANTPVVKPTPEPKFSAWSAVPRGLAVAAGEIGATAADTWGAFKAMRDATPAQRKQMDRTGVPVEAFSSELGDTVRSYWKDYKPDPVTASTAEQLLFGFTRGASKVVVGGLAAGPVGIGLAGLEEGVTQADELRLQGVDVTTRAKAGMVQGVGLAAAALPVVGQTALGTAGLYAIGGPGGFVAQQAATRHILQSAGYDRQAEQFDPFDPVGLAVATLLPAGFAAYGLRQQKLQRAAASLPDLPPRADAVPPADPVAPPAPFPSRPSAIAEAVRAYPTEAVDAARVVLLAERRAAANPGAPDNLRAMDQHEAALSRAEDQLAAGDPVQVADLAPAPRLPTVETPEFRAWFDGSRLVTPEGAPMVLYHGTGADIMQFQVSERGEFGGGIYLTPEANGASDYAVYRGQGPANVMPVYVSIKNPAGAAEASQVASWRGEENARAELIRRGYDGVVDMRSGQVVAFYPEQVKSAIGNSGAFDRTTGSLTDSPYATWADQITAAIRELQAQARPTDAQAAAAQPAAAAADARPTVTNKAGEVFIDTRGTGVRLHGTGKPIAALSDEYALSGDSRNIYGQGFYTTDAADIAAGYMKKGGRNAALYEVRVREDARLYDMERPMSPEVEQIARDNMGDDFPTENGETGAPLTTLREVYDEYRAESRNNGLSRDDVQEVFDGIRYRLEAQGYAGFQHIGGAATGNRAHTVQILWMPERDVTITPISLDQFKPDAPTTPQAANPEAAAPALGAGDAAAAGAADTGRTAAAVEAAGLTLKTDAQIGADLQAKISADFDAAVAEYSALPDSSGGKILNTDTARELSPDYLADRTKSAAVHEPASQFIKDLYARKLAEDPKPGEQPMVLFTAGGTGAGKTSAIVGLPSMAPVVGQAQIIYDTNMNGYASSRAKIDQALAAGKDVRIVLVVRDPADALVNGALPRAENQRRKFGTGRTVPLREHIRTHIGALETVARLADEFADHPNVRISIVDNSLGKGKAAERDRAWLRDVQYNDVERRVTAALESEYAAGRISAETYRGFAGKEPPAADPANTGAAAEAGRVRPDAGPGVRQGAEPAGPEAGLIGSETSAITERGLTVPLRYRLAEAGELTTSHTNDLTANPAFPPELQPRDRARAASAEQISRIENAIRPELLGESVKASDGAPIVGPDAVVESGNARTIALRRAYDSGKADAYRAWLADNAERFGLTRQQVDGLQQPVLVRERLGQVDRAEFARQANESAVAAMSPTEQARSDAGRITDLSGLVANEDGTINATQSADFIRMFVQQAVAPTERGQLLQADGRLSAAGMQRMRNAIFAKAYGDADLVAMLTESTDANVRNILAGMLRAAPEVAKLRDLIEAGARQDADIAGPLVEAVRLFSQLRSEGRTAQQFLAQGSMFGDGPAPGVVSMLQALQADSRAPRRIAEMINGMVDSVNALGDARQGGLFGDALAGADAVAGVAEKAVADSRLAMVAERFPDLQVQLDGMDAPMPMADFMAAAKAEAADMAADAPLMKTAVECFLLNGAG